MNTLEIRKTIALMGVILILSITVQNLFVLFTPLPENPEMARAKADVYVKEAEARLEFQWLKTTLYAGIISLLSGGMLVFSSLWAATKILSKQGFPRKQITGHKL